MAAAPDSPVRPLVAGLAALALSMGIGRFAYTPLLPAMQEAGGFGADVAGLIAAANFAGHLVGALLAAAAPAGRPAERWLRLSLAGAVATTAAMAIAPSPLLWAIVRALSGVACAGAFVLAAGMVVRTLVRQGRPHLAGRQFAGVGGGIVLSGLAAELLLPGLGWRGAWLALAALAALLAVPVWLLREAPGAGGPAARGPLAWPPWPLVLSYGLEGVGYIVTGTFLVAIVVGLPGLAGWGHVAWIVVGLAGMPSVVLWTALARRFGSLRMLVAAHLVQAIGIVLPAVAPGPAVLLVAALCYGGTFIAITALLVELLGRLMPGAVNRAIGVTTAAYGVGQIVGPPVAGLLAEAEGGFAGALAFATATVLAATALLLWPGLASLGGGRRLEGGGRPPAA